MLKATAKRKVRKAKTSTSEIADFTIVKVAPQKKVTKSNRKSMVSWWVREDIFHSQICIISVLADIVVFL
jgi:hypothetical protein